MNNNFRTLFSEDPVFQHLTMALYSMAKLTAYSTEKADLHRKQIYTDAVGPLGAAIACRSIATTIDRDNQILGTALLIVIQVNHTQVSVS